jgi:DNA-binding transcriptional ArsR family regulator
MVENQQSVKSVLSFGAKSVDPEILEQLLIGRSDAAAQLTRSIESIAIHGNNQQILIVGQRGMGKTHLLRILYYRATKYIQAKQLSVAYFTEEEYGIDRFFDFLIRVLYAFIRWNKTDEPWLKERLEELQNTPQPSQPRLLENILRDYIRNRPLLILAENFGDMLNSMGKEEQGKMRAWLYESPRVSIIATSQSLSDDFDREDRPFYGFFTVYYLKSLTRDETLRFLISLADLDGREDVKEYLQHKGKAKVYAVHELVKGNHRLLVTFYEFLKSDTLAALSNHFIKTINDLKPYYETYIRYLPAQQQKIVRYIALSRKPQLGTDIAKNCFIEQSSLSKQLSELVRKGLLEALPDYRDRRNKLYDIHEPLLRISIEIGEHQEGITALFVDFLALFYDEHELWEPERMKPILIDWVVAILGSRHDRLSSSQVEHLKLLLEGIVAQVPEVEVLIQYLNIFKRVVLEKDDNAIYDLSKEQRSFFEKNILHQTR